MKYLNYFTTCCARCFTAVLLLAGIGNASPAVLYVDVNSLSPTPPFTNWTTAATIIQDAVDAAAAGDEIVVTNGVYAVGDRAVNGQTNRVVIDKSLTLRSANGPQFTVIDGGQSNRCVYLTNGASLEGLTLTKGRAVNGGGGVFCLSTNALVSNCVISGNDSGWPAYAGYGGGACFCTLNNCMLTGNWAYLGGGGAYGSTLNNCTLTGNWAIVGGGTRDCTLNNCVVSGNSTGGGEFVGAGGGAYGGTLNNCTLSGNQAITGDSQYRIYSYGGGACYATLNNCTLTGNSATGGWADGGGADWCTLNNCTLIGNWADFGGGASDAILNNCTVTGNWAIEGGGVSAYDEMSVLTNCIVYFNTATWDPNYSGCVLNYCCTTPQPGDGLGNITNAPLFVDEAGGNFRLQSNSPCINAGLNAFAPPGPDLAGNPRIAGGTVDMGAYEFQSPASTISYAWLQQYGLPTDGSADSADTDGDGLNNWQEWRCGTDPTNALSALRLISALPTGTNVAVTWQSAPGVNYFLERALSLSVQPVFTLLATNLLGQPETTTYRDTNALGSGVSFYRVGVSPP